MTLDNGLEFARHTFLKKLLELKHFFAINTHRGRKIRLSK
jgi:IS30 family transposase